MTTRSHASKNTTDTVEALASAGLVDEVLKVGGAGYKVNSAVISCVKRKSSADPARSQRRLRVCVRVAGLQEVGHLRAGGNTE